MGIRGISLVLIVTNFFTIPQLRMFIGFRGILDKNNLYSERGPSSSDQLRVALEIAR
jgi:hypothetical protein